MPYPTEHAARIRDPGNFDPSSFRSKDLKGGVRIIMGKLKFGNGSMVTQAYRFSIDNFTVEEARQWLKDNKIAFIKFEPAKEESMNDKNELKHVGVLGMRWGVRRGDNASGGGRRFGRKQKSGHPEHEEVSRLRKKKIRDMSNQELEKVAKRLELEKRYKNVNPTRVVKGKKAVGGTLSGLGKVVAFAGTVTALAATGKKVFEWAKPYGKTFMEGYKGQ